MESDRALPYPPSLGLARGWLVRLDSAAVIGVGYAVRHPERIHSLVLMNTVALLEDLGHRVFDANSGEEALAVIRREPGIELIVTDQGMPGMTGIQLVETVLAERAAISASSSTS